MSKVSNVFNVNKQKLIHSLRRREKAVFTKRCKDMAEYAGYTSGYYIKDTKVVGYKYPITVKEHIEKRGHYEDRKVCKVLNHVDKDGKAHHEYCEEPYKVFILDKEEIVPEHVEYRRGKKVINTEPRVKRIMIKKKWAKRTKAQQLRATNKQEIFNAWKERDYGRVPKSTRSEHKKKVGNVLWEIW